MSAPLHDRDTIQCALVAFDEELQRRQGRADVHLAGGAAMLLADGERPATHDLDDVWEADRPVREAAWVVARRLDLPKNWLNNQASVYLSARATTGRAVYRGSSSGSVTLQKRTSEQFPEAAAPLCRSVRDARRAH